MLAFLRSKQNSIIVKIFFGIIGFLLVVFFGAKNSDDAKVPQNQAAIVNGDVITINKVDYRLEQHLQNMRTQYNMTDIPENLINVIRNNVVDSLVQQTLLSQNVTSLGIKPTDSEVSQNIKEMFPGEDGQFDRDFYLNKFLPYYKAATNSAFEDDLRHQIAIEKIGKNFDLLFSLSDEEAKTIHKRQNTKYRFMVVKVPKFITKPTADNAADSATIKPEELSQEANPNARATAEDVFAKWSSGQDLGKLLKPVNLEQRVTSPLNLAQLDRVFDNDATVEDWLAIGKLTMAKPFPEKIFEKENDFYLIKLDDKTDAPAPDEKAIATVKSTYKEQMSQSLQNAWIHALETTADIKKSQDL